MKHDHTTLTALSLCCCLAALAHAAPVEAPTDWATLAVEQIADGRTAHGVTNYFRESEHEVTVEAALKLDAAAAAGGTLVDRPGMYRLSITPADAGAELVWTVRAGGAWRTVAMPLEAAGAHQVVASFDGQAMRLRLDESSTETAHRGLMSRNTLGARFGARHDDSAPFQGGSATIRVSRIVRDDGTFMARAAFPEAGVAMMAVAPVAYDTTTPIRRPDGIVVNARQVLAAPSLTVPRTPRAPAIDGAADDACWQAQLPARTLPVNVNYRANCRTPSETTIEFKLSYDAAHLYGLMRVIAPRPDTLKIGGAARDDYAALADNVELFLIPSDDVSVGYHQICLGLGGGVFDQHVNGNRNRGWNANGLNCKVAVTDGVAVIEFALPFADLGVAPPSEGATWRGNVFAGLESGHVSWSFIWPLAHDVARFGELIFGGGLAAERVGPPCSVRGRLLDGAGRPVVWANYDAAGGVGVGGAHTRTAADGSFELNGLKPGPQRLQTFIPTWEAVAFEIDGAPGMNDLGEIRMAPKRTRLARWTAPADVAQGDDVAWLRTWTCCPPDLETPPAAEQWRDPSPAAILAQGETEGVAAAFYARRDIAAPVAKAIFISAPQGASGSGPTLRMDWIARQLAVNGSVNPPEDSGYRWAHLRAEAPDRISQGEVGLVTVTLEAPTDATPGEYRGRIDLHEGEQVVSSLPFSVTVAPFALANPEKMVGQYHYNTLGIGPRPNVYKSEELLRAEAEDIRRHGNRAVMLNCAPMDYAARNRASLLDAIRTCAEAGITTIVTSFHPIARDYWWNPDLMRALFRRKNLKAECEAFERELKAIEAAYPGVEIIVNFNDEVTISTPKWQAFVLQTEFYAGLKTGRPVYITASLEHVGKMGALAHKPEIVNWSIASTRRMPGLDISEALDAWAERAEAVGYPTNWCYNNEPATQAPGVFTRLASGYWLWASPFEMHLPWGYSVYQNDPFDPFDNVSRTDLGFAFPEKKDGKWTVVGTIKWEAWRDGYDDLRWIATLEEALAGSDLPEGAAARTEAAVVLDTFRSYHPDVEKMAKAFPPERFTERRKTMLHLIGKL
jgi:hypothetical protein